MAPSGQRRDAAEPVRQGPRHRGPLLVGRSVFDLGILLSEVEDRLAGNLYVQAAVGDALYDLMARSLDLPVHDLLGGANARKSRSASRSA